MEKNSSVGKYFSNFDYVTYSIFSLEENTDD